MVINVHRRKDARRARTYRCFLNGRDITNDCFYADPRRGIVRVYLRNAEGRAYLTEGMVAKAELRGRVHLRKQAA
jgi:hypothetical protein